MRALLSLLVFPALLTLPATQATATAWPDRFTVFWNVPTEACYLNYGIEMPLEEYGIVANANQSLNGGKVATLYEYEYKFPHFTKYNVADPKNGGMPQLVDVDAHLAQFERLINKNLPDVNHNGPFYLDVEEWRPMYHLNWSKKDVYKTQSQLIVQERIAREGGTPLTGAALEKQAEKEFNDAARNLLTRSIAKAKELRPKAMFAMYGFPYCDWPGDYREGKHNYGKMECNPNYLQQNNDLQWLYDQFDALGPSIYVSKSNEDQTVGIANHRFMHAYMQESTRVSKKSPKRPVIAPYTKFEYEPYQPNVDLMHFYTKRDLCSSLKMTADWGAAGALMWSGSQAMSRERCARIRTNIVHSLGPVVTLVRKRVARCAKEKCSDRGRCVRNKPWGLNEECNFRMPPADYDCVCDEGYKGTKCESKI